MKNHENRHGTMKNKPGTIKNHENPPRTIKKTHEKPTWSYGKPWKQTRNHEKRPGTMKTLNNQPGTMKNQPGTMNNLPGTMKNQPRTMKNMKNHEKPWKTNLEPWQTMKNRPPSKKWSFFVTHAGSQLTIMTQNEKVLILRHPRGVTTDLLDV